MWIAGIVLLSFNEFSVFRMEFWQLKILALFPTVMQLKLVPNMIPRYSKIKWIDLDQMINASGDTMSPNIMCACPCAALPATWAASTVLVGLLCMSLPSWDCSKYVRIDLLGIYRFQVIDPVLHACMYGMHVSACDRMAPICSDSKRASKQADKQSNKWYP